LNVVNIIVNIFANNNQSVSQSFIDDYIDRAHEKMDIYRVHVHTYTSAVLP